MTTRPHVVVYVTREHPVTGEDQLLVFDFIDQRKFSTVVPGGGIDPGETIEQAARREVFEETGIEISLMRELGSEDRSRFVQAAPLGLTPEEWEHRNPPGPGVESEELVRCRWVSVRTKVWGNRGAFLHALLRQRVVAYVTRQRDGRTELLTIEHGDIPDLGVQVPAGRLDPGEDLEAGLRREVEEETGVGSLRIGEQLVDGAEFELLYGPGAHESFAFHAVADSGGPDEWQHPVTGTGADAGFTYLCRWVPLQVDFPLWGKRDPLLERLVRSIQGR